MTKDNTNITEKNNQVAEFEKQKQELITFIRLSESAYIISFLCGITDGMKEKWE